MYIALDLTGSGKLYAANRPLALEEKGEEEEEKKKKKNAGRRPEKREPREGEACARRRR